MSGIIFIICVNYFTFWDKSLSSFIVIFALSFSNYFWAWVIASVFLFICIGCLSLVLRFFYISLSWSFVFRDVILPTRPTNGSNDTEFILPSLGNLPSLLSSLSPKSEERIEFYRGPISNLTLDYSIILLLLLLLFD